MVEEEDAVEVVDLVLDGAGLEPGRLLPESVAVAVGGLDDDPLRPAHVAVDLGDREAALLGRRRGPRVSTMTGSIISNRSSSASTTATRRATPT